MARPGSLPLENSSPMSETFVPLAMTGSKGEAARWILDRCDELATYSSRDDALERVFLSPQHRAVNDLVAEWMRDAGLAVHEDPAGNLIGRIEARAGTSSAGVSTTEAPAIVVGSHLDTVPDAGRYDGMLGVLLGIALAQRIRTRRSRNAGDELPCALEVIAFWDEEGTRFGTALFGSKAMTGTLDDGWRQIADADGVTIEQAFRDFGLDPDAVESARRDHSEFVAYLEAHIEQRPFLDRAGNPLGVVTAIAGAQRMLWRIIGESRHAGTPYDMRRDALLGASAAIVAVDAAAANLPGTATIGSLFVHPNAANIVSGEVAFTLDYRSVSDTDRVRGVAVLSAAVRRECAAHGLICEMTTTHEAAAVACAPHLRDILRTAIEHTGHQDPLDLPSIAGHDAMAMAELTDVGMLFIRCAGGVSHSPDEHVRAEDVADALEALDYAVRAAMEQWTGAVGKKNG